MKPSHTGGSFKVVREIRDTVGVALVLRTGDPVPKEGGTVAAKTESGEEFTLRVSKVQRTKTGHCAWCWLRKGAGDGKRWRKCRLQKVTVTVTY